MWMQTVFPLSTLILMNVLSFNIFHAVQKQRKLEFKKALGDFASRSKQNKVYSEGWGKQVGKPLNWL